MSRVKAIEGRVEALARLVMLGTHKTPLYRKVAPVRAIELHEDVTVDTPEGTMEAHAGDFLVSDDPPTHLWPVKREVFLRTYEVAE
jgi:hypothetical protein